MVKPGLSSLIEDHALESVPPGERENWLKISEHCGADHHAGDHFSRSGVFRRRRQIALLDGIVSFIGSARLALARVTVETGFSNTLITRRHGLRHLPCLDYFT
jgi:hypothetical protein